MIIGVLRSPRNFATSLVVLALLVIAAGGETAPVTAVDAETVVVNWLLMESRPLGADLDCAVREVRTYPGSSQAPAYYVVSLIPSGYVIVSADDLVEPIIAFSPDGDYEGVPGNPVCALLVTDLAGRMARAEALAGGPVGLPDNDQIIANQKWDWLLSGGERQPLGGLSSVSDPRVDPFVVSKWSQTTEGGACYNYYTPPGDAGSSGNYPSGCVATAMAQVMRFWQYPTAGIGVNSFSCSVCASPTTLSTRGGNGSGGSYDWANMPLDPDSGTTTVQRQAIGALCYDAGVSVEMDYCTGGSASDTLQAATALKSTFGYGQAHKGYNSGSDLPSEPRNRMVNSNLHAGYPVILGITGSAGGHAVVCDGYGYNVSTLYHHLNMGWAGSQTAWYNLPTIDTSPSFNSVYKCVYNIFTTGSGEIIAGRVTDCAGAPIAGATVTTGSFSDTTDSRGIYGLKVSSSASYTVSVQKAGYTFTSQAVTTGNSSDYTTTCGNKWPIDFTATCAPSPPTNPGTTNVTTSGIRWTWTDNSSDETGFKVYADQGACSPTTLRATTAANATYWDYSGLTANCQYCFQVAATNGSLDSSKTVCTSKYTLAGPPAEGSNVTCDKSKNVWYPAGTTFTFTNPAGFGMCGQYKVSKFRWVMNTSSTHTWTGSEAEWASGSLVQTPAQTGTYYLHLQSFNAENVANSTTLDLGPYRLDANPPSTPGITDDGAMQTGTSQLHASWTSGDANSGICEYQYAIGTQPTDPGSGYVLAWKSAGSSTEVTESGLSLQYGASYYWYVKARDCAGNWSGVGASDGIAVVQTMADSVRAAKMLGDGVSVGIASRAVTAVLDDAIYVQDAGNPAGIRVQSDVIPTGLAAGKLVDVAGLLSTTSSGERVIQAALRDTLATSTIGPVGMNNSWLGGRDWNYDSGTGAGQQGIDGAVDVNNVGLLVRTWGRVKPAPAGDTVVASWSFDADPGWTLQGQWAWGTPSGGGSHCLDSTSGYTGSKVVGYNLFGDYPNSLGAIYYATTPAVNCSGATGVRLQYRRWLGVESSSFDHASVQVSNNGTVWTTIWSNPSSDLCDGAWTLQTYDISSIVDGQPTVYVRWGMGTTDSSVNYPGWNIDDVILTGQSSQTVVIDDGSGVGVEVVYPIGAPLPAVGDYVTVTGISSCSKDEQGTIKRLIRATP
jgi:hypothetical protein